jgi:hypothetical protein
VKRLAVALALVLLAACNRGDDPTVDLGATTTSSPSTSSSVAETTSPSTTFVPTPLPATGPASATRGYLAAVRVASHDGYDRIVFDFEDAVPGYRVDVTRRPVTEDGSGNAVEVKGEVLYEVRFENAATARIEGERVVPVFKGDTRITMRGKVLEEVVKTGDFEGVVTWVIGARPRPEGVQVSTLRSPLRLVVDLGSPR